MYSVCLYVYSRTRSPDDRGGTRTRGLAIDNHLSRMEEVVSFEEDNLLPRKQPGSTSLDLGNPCCIDVTSTDRTALMAGISDRAQQMMVVLEGLIKYKVTVVQIGRVVLGSP